MSDAAQPVSVAQFVGAIRELSDDNLRSLRTQLETSLAKLRATNDYLADALSGADADDTALFTDTIDENKGVIANQTEKLKVLALELALRPT